ncbi:hypothetical protein JL108_05610 [Aeromicrobium sp. YIM 150415]|uniref:hypothetical protein n=1 Tax=Aeromicrobium TaxID=2040 RepID=UPI00163D88A0|nr:MULTISPECIES: hypothetical protein [Aeromicrobium]MBM9462919.1 hypothetical protein [Aeromicrobium sp. YIM 150415]
MLKKLVVLVIAGFVLYYLLTAPEGAARAVGDAWDATLGAFAQVGVFIDSLFGT